MLLLREDKFVEHDGKLYIVGSSSNALYSNNAYTMGKLDILCWKLPAERYNEKLEEYIPNPNIKLLIYDGSLSFSKKRKIIKKEVKKANCIIAKLSLLQAIIGCHYAIKYKKVLIVESAADAFAALWYHGGGIKYKLAAIPINFLIKRYHRKADFAIYCSQLYLQEKYPCKCEHIGCADAVMALPKMENLDSRIVKIRNREDNAPFIVGLIGATQAEYRGHDVLIAAVGVLKRKGYNVKIKFLGGGRADEKRIKYAKKWGVAEQIEFCGYLPHNKVLEWLDELDLLVMPTKAEALGRAVVEAMSRACPVIGSKETALSELLSGDCLVHATNYNEVANRIEKFISNKQFAEYIALENFYRSFKFNSEFTNSIRHDFYSKIRETVGNEQYI